MPMHMTSSSLAHPVLVRTSLPKKVDMETFKLSNKDVFFVLSPDTMEYIFEKDCILSQSILADLGLTLTPADLARQLIGLVKGLRSGAIPKDEFGPVGAGVLKAGAAIVLYTLYPPTPRGYQLWCRLADKLWTSVGQMADLYE